MMVLKQIIRLFIAFVCGIIVTVVVAIGVLIGSGNIRFNTNESKHESQVFVDGKLVSTNEWSEITGGGITIKIEDGIHIGN